MVKADLEELFDRRITFPDSEAGERLGALVGIDEQRGRLENEISLRLKPELLGSWFKLYHPTATRAKELMLRRPPLVVLAGDVGCGKTALAQDIGDAVARRHALNVTLFPLSLSTRGQGRVGEMTQLLSSAFDHVVEEGRRLRVNDGEGRAGLVLLVDEADALAQSREAAQMHHEDRAGVNALIRGIDQIADARVPVAVIMCTNRPGSLDPAVKRRSADILTFSRPDATQRSAVLEEMFAGFAFSGQELAQLVAATGPRDSRDFGFTFSDLTQRLLPTVVLGGYPRRGVSAGSAIEIAKKIVPTAPFREQAP